MSSRTLQRQVWTSPPPARVVAKVHQAVAADVSRRTDHERSQRRLTSAVALSRALTSNSDLLWPFSSIHQKQHRHSHRQSIRDLFQNQRAAAICNLAVNFHPPVDWAGMHDQ